MQANGDLKAYWRSVLRATCVLGAMWAATAVLLPWMAPGLAGAVLGFPLGYWLASQGALFGFLAIVVACVVWMGRIDARHAAEPASGASSESEDGAP